MKLSSTLLLLCGRNAASSAQPLDISIYAFRNLEESEPASPRDSKTAIEQKLERRRVDVEVVLDVLESIGEMTDGELDVQALRSTSVVLQMRPMNRLKREDLVRTVPAQLVRSASALRSVIGDLAKQYRVSDDDMIRSAIELAEGIAARICQRERRRDARLRMACIPSAREFEPLIRYAAHFDRIDSQESAASRAPPTFAQRAGCASANSDSDSD